MGWALGWIGLAWVDGWMVGWVDERGVRKVGEVGGSSFGSVSIST
jgi:hypothetical protein